MKEIRDKICQLLDIPQMPWDVLYDIYFRFRSLEQELFSIGDRDALNPKLGEILSSLPTENQNVLATYFKER